MAAKGKNWPTVIRRAITAPYQRNPKEMAIFFAKLEKQLAKEVAHTSGTSR